MIQDLDKEIIVNKQCFEDEDAIPIRPAADRLLAGIQITYIGKDICNNCGGDVGCTNCKGKTFYEYAVSFFENDELLIKHTNAPFEIIRSQFIVKAIPFFAIRNGVGIECYAEAHTPLCDKRGFEGDIINYVRANLERPPLIRKHVDGESVVMKWMEYDGMTLNF